MQVTCVVCSTTFNGYRSTARYCSDACKQKAYRARRPKVVDEAAKAASNARSRAWRAANLDRAKELNRKWQAQNREKTRANARRFAARNPGYGRMSALRRLFGLTVEQYEVMHQAQRGLCAVCKRPETSLHQSGNVRRLAVDHDHDTGAVRELLCHDCNIGMGLFRDEPDRLDAAAAYLRRHSK